MPEAEESIVSSKPLALRTTTGRIGGGDEGGATGVTGKLVGRLKIGTGDSKILFGFSITHSGMGMSLSYLDQEEEFLALHDTLKLKLDESTLTLQKSSGRARLPSSSTVLIQPRSACGYGVEQLTLHRILRTFLALTRISLLGKV